MRYCRLICSKKWLSERPNWRGMFLRLEETTVVEWCENRSCFSLSGCHLAVSQNWAGYHTSFERGDSGLPADLKIRTVIQLIGILWSYFGMLRGLANILNILVCHLPISHRCQGYHTSFERKYKELSFNPNCLHITHLISLFWLHSYSYSSRPRIHLFGTTKNWYTPRMFICVGTRFQCSATQPLRKRC